MEFFGTDGIRGNSNEFPFDNKTVSLIGYVLAKNIAKNGNGILIGRDTRESGNRILKALQRGINEAGVKVIDLGVVPTPAVAYLLKHNNYQAGIVISASHNPYHDNGIKFFNSKGMKLPDAIETKLEKELVKYINKKKEIVLKNKIKNQSGKSLIKQYQNFLISLLPKNSLKNKKIIIDCANGASYKIAQDVLKKLKATVVVINNKPTGKNINLNCGALHPEVVSGIVKKENAFCGFAFDGDADRVIAVDDKGVVRDGDYFLAVVAKHLKGNNKLKNNTLVITVMANLGLLKAMKEAGINTVVSKVGDRYVYDDLKKHKAILGGEQSGHIIFKNLLDTGDGIISALQLLNILVAGSGNNKLSDLCSWIKKYPQILINEKVVKKIPIKDLPETSKLINKIELKLADNGRVLVRYSGTENLLRVMIEGQDKTEIKKLAQDIINIAKQEISKL
ncbi:MAG: phosphoglucosamine mutase [Endomicrobiaceae bacterium]|nr:phosphoglucosamine mutase [Endomicrobiaceae bacterium]